MDGLRDKHVIITGAGGGIGRALVAVFRASGARITACDSGPDALAGIEGVEPECFELTDAVATARGVESAIRRNGPPDILVSNAGFTSVETLEALDAAAWDREIAVHLSGAYNVTVPVLADMRRAGGGSIVFVSTVNALAHYGNPAYAAAKSGLLAFARAIAVEHGRDGIRANCVCPGTVRTPAWDRRLALRPGLLEEIGRHYPLGRIVTTEEVANTVAFLASPLAGGITGVALAVDAGLTAGNLGFLRDVVVG